MIVYTDKHKIPFQIDEDDYEAVSHYSWHIGDNGYPATRIDKRIPRRLVRLHRFLLSPGLSQEVDHVDRDKLNNRRENLRIVSRVINMRNIGLTSKNKSGVRGVHWSKQMKRWTAQIRCPGRTKYLGYYRTIEGAKAARLAAEQQLWGDQR